MRILLLAVDDEALEPFVPVAGIGGLQHMCAQGSGCSAALQLAEDAHLVEGVKITCGIGKARLVRAVDGLTLVDIEDDSSQVKNDGSCHCL